MRKNKIFAEITKNTMLLSTSGILNKIEGVAQESKKDKIRREALEKQQREKEKQEAARME